MRAYFLRGGDGRAHFEGRDVPLPEPGPQQVRVRVRAASLNRGELMGAGSTAKPAGMDAAGEVEKLGAGVTQLRIGQRVMGRCPGAFAEHALMDARETMAVPELGGGRRGAELGLDVALATREPDFADAVRAATAERGADLCVNTVGGSVLGECVRALAFEGRLAVVGSVDGVRKTEIDLDTLHAKRLTLFGVSNKLRSAEQRGQTVRGFVDDVLPLIAEGRIKPLIDRVYPLAELPAAVARLESNLHVGKIVVTV